MGGRPSVSYIKLLVTGWTAGAVKQGEGSVVAARRNTPRQIREQQIGSIARLGRLNIAMQNMLKVKVVSSTLVLPGEH